MVLINQSITGGVKNLSAAKIVLGGLARITTWFYYYVDKREVSREYSEGGEGMEGMHQQNPPYL